jgi:hypothetical protein
MPGRHAGNGATGIGFFIYGDFSNFLTRTLLSA